MNGIINIFKPEGITSNGVIKEIKKLTGENKIGHIGTLDPLAKGVLPLFLGKYTKLIPYCNLDDKVYEAVAHLGATSTTLDREGDISAVPIPDNCNMEAVMNCLQSFLGESEQIPPMYSAIKVNGKKLYEYARAGKTIQRKPRQISIYAIKLIELRFPEITFEVKCSKGTYIRTLVDDIAKKLGTRAYLKDLTRLASGAFFVENNALALERAKKMDKSDLQRKFIDPKYILSDWHDVEISSTILLKHISQGRTIPVPLDTERSFSPKERISKAIATTQSRELVATGNLEFSQDAGCRFSPEKVFI